MNRIPLITSIPPRLSRRDSQNREVGSEYLEACISSWLRSGFAPVSVNSASENVAPLSGVEFVTVPRDASSTVGKPLVYFHDLISTALHLFSGPIAITNADILLEPSFGLCRLVQSIKPGEALFARRIDITSLDSRSGRPYRYGLDFFAAHACDLQRLPDFSLIFGAPWWDYFLPTTLYSTGTRMHLLRQPFAYHLEHEERVHKGLWTTIGAGYAKRLGRYLDHATTTEGLDVLHRVRRAFRNTATYRAGSLSSRVKYNLPWLYSARSDMMLRYLTRETMSFIEEQQQR